MSELVAFYVEKPIDLRGQVELRQAPVTSVPAEVAASGGGVVHPSLVYVEVPREAGPRLVPFADYDEWSMQSRYNEAIRIMNTLGASAITCEAYQDVAVHRSLRAMVLKKGPQVKQRKLESTRYDYRHAGTGSAPRDPRPLRWPDEPGFMAAVSSVLENGSAEVALTISNNRVHDVNGDLALKLKKVGFDLGVASQRTGATSLHIRAEFPPPKKPWW